MPHVFDDERLHWVSEHMPVLIEFSTGPTDQWLRDAIRGSEGVTPPPLHRVIVQGSDEADRIVNRLANVKYAKRLPYGGALHRRASSAEIRNLVDTGGFVSDRDLPSTARNAPHQVPRLDRD